MNETLTPPQTPSPTVNATLSIHQVLLFLTEYGSHYLGAGGSAARLEEAIAELGRKLGFQSEVFALPTGVFVSCISPNGETHTTIMRIKECSMNLGFLCALEEILADVYTQKLPLARAIRLLKSKNVHQSPYPPHTSVLAAFGCGFSLSYPAFGVFWAAVASGVITVLTWWISGPVLKRLLASPIFRDFGGCVIALTLSALVQVFLPGHIEACSIGALILLVPGLSLTTAIAEIADHDLVSGTAKFMHSILTLLALGIATMLFYDFSHRLGYGMPIHEKRWTAPVIISSIGIMTAVFCFGVLFKVPKRSLIWSTLTGVTGWFILHQFKDTPYFVSGSFFASLGVGFISLVLARSFKVPSQVYSVPGILAMLPGMLALTSFRSFALGEQGSGIELGFKVALTAGSIVFGLLSARIPIALFEHQVRFPVRKLKLPIGRLAAFRKNHYKSKIRAE